MENPTPWARSSYGRDAWTKCTAAEGVGEFCDADVPTGAPVSMCGAHLVAAYRFCEEALGLAERSERLERLTDLDRRRTGQTGDAVVYYMLFGRTIKIGATTNLRQRIRHLQPDRVLATEPGYFDLERKRQQQFRHLKLNDGRLEFFRLGADLMRFIGGLPGSEVPTPPPPRKGTGPGALQVQRGLEATGPEGQQSMFDPTD